MHNLNLIVQQLNTLGVSALVGHLLTLQLIKNSKMLSATMTSWLMQTLVRWGDLSARIPGKSWKIMKLIWFWSHHRSGLLKHAEECSRTEKFQSLLSPSSLKPSNTAVISAVALPRRKKDTQIMILKNSSKWAKIGT